MTIDFWACLIIFQIYFVTVNKDKRGMLTFGSVAWFTLATINLFVYIIAK